MLSLSLWLGWGLGGAQAAPDVAAENALIAAYLANFARFTQWPDSAFESPNSPLRLCVSGARDGLPEALEALASRQIQGRPVRVFTQIPRPELRTCHLIFVADARPLAVIQAVKDEPVLTVSDGHGFLLSGGMIALTREGTRLQFLIDPLSVQKAGLNMSSQLLSLAQGAAVAASAPTAPPSASQPLGGSPP